MNLLQTESLVFRRLGIKTDIVQKPWIKKKRKEKKEKRRGWRREEGSFQG